MSIKPFPAEQLQKTKELYPHIYAKLEIMWGYPEMDIYINNLLMDTRDGKRNGFPPDVGQELLKLQNGNLNNTDNWDTLY